MALLLFGCASVEESDAVIGQCARNRTNGMVIGRIVERTINPAFQTAAFRVITSEGRRLFISPDLVETLDCAAAESLAGEERAAADSLVGGCAFNRSDDRFLGRVVRIGVKDRNHLGESEAGIRMLTVAYHREFRDALGRSSDDFTYPRTITVRRCARGID